jgi:hypothetical protein
MALYLVLNDFRSSQNGLILRTGQKIESTQVPFAAMQAAGLVAVAYTTAMDTALAAWASNSNRTSVELFMLLTLTGIDVSGVIKSDGSVAFTAAQSMGGFKLTSLGAPTASSTDAARAADIDASNLANGRAVSGGSDTLLQTDVCVDYAIACNVAIPALTVAAGKKLTFLLQRKTAAALVIAPPTGGTIDGGSVNATLTTAATIGATPLRSAIGDNLTWFSA